MAAYDLEIRSGIPFSKSFVMTLPEGRSWWTEASDFEVLSQVRKKEDVTSDLILDLAQFIQKTLTSPDVVLIDLVMNGAATRQLVASGFYDVIVSDAGTADARAYRISHGKVKRYSVVTASAVAP